MLSLDAAFDRIGSGPPAAGIRLERRRRRPTRRRPARRLHVAEHVGAHLLDGRRAADAQVKVDGEWVEFARRGFGPDGLEDTAVEALVRAVFNEVAETSTDAG